LNLYWDSWLQPKEVESFMAKSILSMWFDVWQWLSCLAFSCNPWGLVSLFKSVYCVDVSIDWYCIKPLVIFDRNHTAMHTHVRWSVHLSALLITWFTWGDG
jgi:hypothetical protein